MEKTNRIVVVIVGAARLTIKQSAFIDAYIELGNATQAALKAGYNKKTAYSIGSENLKKPEIKNAIDERLAAIESARIAKPKEVMEYLTAVLRGESEAEEIVIEGCGPGESEARTMKKRPSEKEKLKAASELFKRFDAATTSGEGQVTIIDDIPKPE